jgi:hypothetical protein
MSLYLKRAKAKLIIKRIVKLFAEYEPYSHNSIDYYKLNAEYPEMANLMDSLSDTVENIDFGETEIMGKKAQKYFDTESSKPKYKDSLGTKELLTPIKKTLRRFQFGFLNKELTNEQLDALIRVEELLRKAEAAFPKHKKDVIMKHKIAQETTEK